MPDLTPQIWSKLPHDILFVIVDCLDLPDWKEWSCVSQAFFPYASARIWRTIRIKARHIETFRCSQEGETEGHHEALQHNILHRLTHNACRKFPSPVFQGIREDTPMHIYHPKVEYPDEASVGLPRIPASLPGSWVRHLELFDRGPSLQIDLKSSDVLTQLFSHLDGLRKISYDGKLNSNTLAKITQIRTLTSLCLRVGSEQASLSLNYRLYRGPWIPVTLEFGLLSALPHLRILHIGHLANGEAEGLARSVMSLKLESLHVSTFGWLIFHGDKPKVARNFRVVSPLIVFLHALATLPLVDESQPRGFPLTLRSLILCDKFYPRLPFLHQRLMRLITHCEMLDCIKLELLVSGPVSPDNGFDDINIPSTNVIVSLQSWDQLSQIGEVPITYRVWYIEHGAVGRTVSKIARYPKDGCGHVTNISKVLDENIAKQLHDWLRNQQQPGQYLRSMRFIKESHGDRKILEDGVVEVHWGRSWFLSSGQLSVEQYLRHVGFGKRPYE